MATSKRMKYLKSVGKVNISFDALKTEYEDLKTRADRMGKTRWECLNKAIADWNKKHRKV